MDTYIKHLINDDANSVIRILDSYTDTTYELGENISHKSDFEREQYNGITSVLNPDIIINGIQKLTGKLPETGENYPYKDDNKDDEYILLKQFLWLHRHVQNEKQSDAPNNNFKK